MCGALQKARLPPLVHKILSLPCRVQNQCAGLEMAFSCLDCTEAFLWPFIHSERTRGYLLMHAKHLHLPSRHLDRYTVFFIYLMAAFFFDGIHYGICKTMLLILGSRVMLYSEMRQHSRDESFNTHNIYTSTENNPHSAIHTVQHIR